MFESFYLLEENINLLKLEFLFLNVIKEVFKLCLVDKYYM